MLAMRCMWWLWVLWGVGCIVDRYPSWAADGTEYTTFTDGTVAGLSVSSCGPCHGNNGSSITQGQAHIVGDGTSGATITAVKDFTCSALPFQGRYPSGNLFYKVRAPSSWTLWSGCGGMGRQPKRGQGAWAVYDRDHGVLPLLTVAARCTWRDCRPVVCAQGTWYYGSYTLGSLKGNKQYPCANW